MAVMAVAISQYCWVDFINNFSSTFVLHVVNTGFSGPATLRVRYANGTGVSEGMPNIDSPPGLTRV